MLIALRWVLNTVAYHAALLFAVHIAVRPKGSEIAMCDVSSSASTTGSRAGSTSRRISDNIPATTNDDLTVEGSSNDVLATSANKDVLKLWIMLGLIVSFSDTLGHSVLGWIPMFYEARTILVWVLLLLEGKSWSQLYDRIVSPMAQHILVKGHALKHHPHVQRAMLWSASIGCSAFLFLVETTASTGCFGNDGEPLVEQLLLFQQSLANQSVQSASRKSVASEEDNKRS